MNKCSKTLIGIIILTAAAAAAIAAYIVKRSS